MMKAKQETRQKKTADDRQRQRVARLREILETYREGKRALDQRIVRAEQYWKLRHWRDIRARNPGEPEPASAWLVNTILSKHSDAVEAYPEPVFLAREESDQPEAEALSSIVPVVLQDNDFPAVWSDVWWYKLKSGTGVYGVFWDSTKQGGLGDISIRKIDLLNLFWEPGIRDIQDSRYVFYVQLLDIQKVEAAWPALKGTLSEDRNLVRQYQYDEHISTQGKTAVVDVYYKKGGRVHFCKFVGDTMLYATEENPVTARRGIYDHGKYPFVFDALFPEEGYPGCGYGYVDLCRDSQNAIDMLNNCVLQNAVAAATPRWFVRRDGGVNEEEYADMTRKFVHVSGRITDDSVRQIVTQPVSQGCLSYMQMKINEMKETAGNRDVNNGGTSASLTAASAIAALQEAGNGLSRDMIAASYRAFRHVTELCMELIRQFYTLPRRFRILGPWGSARYITYSNQGLTLQSRDGLERLPVFDIQVEVQTENPYRKQTRNDLAVQLYQMGIFAPEKADQALMLLSMMDFKGKTELVRQVERNHRLYRQERAAVTAAITGTPGAAPGEHPFQEKARAMAGDLP